ncbi:diadenylate cyclase [Candidatus Hydrogenedentota bacterium]
MLDVIHGFRIADALDILVVALFVYAILSWFRRTASRSILLGIISLSIIYFLADFLGMRMTTTLFQMVLAVMAIGLVVIFQEDLRRGFEALAFWERRRGRSRSHGDSNTIDIIVESLAELAEKKVGALVVLTGNESIERHIRGDIPVDGLLSKPLIDSLFDPSSKGHDGAVVVKDERAISFSAHLPLSKNIKELKTHGTRHSAALGLSEVSDALIIVISEETGKLSVAEEGRLRTMKSVTELRKEMERHWNRCYADRATFKNYRISPRSIALKVLCLLIALLVWVATGSETESVQKTFLVPVEFRNAPGDLIITESIPPEIRVTVIAQRHVVERLILNQLKISVDVAGLKNGTHEILIENMHVKRPANVSVYRVDPEMLRITVEDLAKQTTE